MRRPPLGLLLFTLALAVPWLLPAGPLRAQEPVGSLSFLEFFRDSLGVESGLPSGQDPESDSCYFPYPESLHTAPFRKVFQLYTSDAVVNGYGPGIAAPWSAAQFDTFMNAVFDGDPNTDTDIFPKVWDYFCFSDLAPEEDSIHVVRADSSITRLQIALYHVWNFRHKWDNQGTNPEYCDTLRTRFPESDRYGTADENGVVFPVNPSTRVGCGEHWDTDLFSPIQAATYGAFAHELQHAADGANTGAFSGGPKSEFLSTAAEYLSGVRWTQHRGMREVDQGLYTRRSPPSYDLYRLWAAYLFGHFSADPGVVTDDLLYQTVRHIGPGQTVPSASFYGLGQILASAFPDAVPGGDGHEKIGNLYHRFAMARFADDSTGFAGGIYGFGSSGVSPRNFGWFEWVDTCRPRVDWMPPDVTCGEALVDSPVELATWTDAVDTVYVNQSRDLTLSTFGSEVVVFRADSTFFTGGMRQTLRVRLASPDVMPAGHEVKVGVLEYAADGEPLFEEPLFRVRESVPVTLVEGKLETELDIADFGDSTRAAVVVVSLVPNPVPYWWGEVNSSLPLVVDVSYGADTTRVPFDELAIQDAIDLTAPGNVVAVAGQFGGAAYNGAIELRSGVRVIGVDEGDGYPILNAGTDSIAVVFPETASSLTAIEHFTVRGGTEGLIHLRGRGRVKRCTLEAPASTAPFFGVRADSTDDLALVQDCRITLNQGTGVLGLAMGGTVLRDTIAVAAGNGIRVLDGGPAIASTIVSVGSGTGIDLRGAGVADSCVVSVATGTGVFLHGGTAALVFRFGSHVNEFSGRLS